LSRLPGGVICDLHRLKTDFLFKRGGSGADKKKKANWGDEGEPKPFCHHLSWSLEENGLRGNGKADKTGGKRTARLKRGDVHPKTTSAGTAIS